MVCVREEKLIFSVDDAGWSSARKSYGVWGESGFPRRSPWNGWNSTPAEVDSCFQRVKDKLRRRSSSEALEVREVIAVGAGSPRPEPSSVKPGAARRRRSVPKHCIEFPKI